MGTGPRNQTPTDREPVRFVEVPLAELGLRDTPHYHRTPAMVLWVAGPSLAGVSLRGVQRTSDLRLAQTCYQAIFGPPHRRALLGDMRRFRTDDVAIFDGLLRFPPASPPRAGLLFPSDWSHAWWLGAMAMGALIVTPTRVFTDSEEAWDWLGGPPALHRELYEVVARADPDPSQPALEALLRQDPGRDLASSARALGLSARSLQRVLGQSGERFADVRDRARVEIASARLAQSDDKIDSVAANTGFRSRSHFIAWFRRMTGMSPAAFRDQHRSARASSG